jgi:tetratricopeptide (TPR) repeat protein
MSSLIPGYEYDIFISYRQKDNKHDGWVTEFVNNLKGELESTFKEEISVYFDINPHDGLLETHDVNASLKEKLKCLIFIPIISRTYCDPNSFAWEHEFKPFVELASQDKFGLKVKLPNGNVANRVLPVRIHDLDSEDIKLCESILGGILRGVEFIYREPGVNRSLTPKDDERKNLNGTIYRNQINKVTLAIKEIILGLKTEPVIAVKENALHKEPTDEVYNEYNQIDKEKTTKLSKRKLLLGISILAILLIATLLAYPKIFKQDTLDKLRSSGERISIAVMPFQNMTNDTIWNVWQDGIQDILITSLSNSEELKVRQRESVTSIFKSKGLANYTSITPSVASTISQKLEANIFIYGSIKQEGITIRVNAQLIDTKTKEVFKSFQLDGTNEKIMSTIDSLSTMVKNFLIIYELKNEHSDITDSNLSTKSPEAYRYYLYGLKSFLKSDFTASRNMFIQALAIDSNYTTAMFYTSVSYGNQGLYEQAKKWCLKSCEKRDLMTMHYKLYTNWLYANYFETPHEEIKYLKQILALDDQDRVAYFVLGNCYRELEQYEEAIPEYKKAIDISIKWNSKPEWFLSYTYLGEVYHKTRKFKEERKIYDKAERFFPDNPSLIYRQAVLALSEGKVGKATEYIEKIISISKESTISEAEITTNETENYSSEPDVIRNVAEIYLESNILDKAEEYFRKTLLLQPDNPERINNLAYFLIDKDRNINQALGLSEKAIELRPESYNYMHTMGWGLYKQGKYNEAFDILQKSWDLRMKNAIYDHEAFLHLEAAKNAVANQK